MGKSLAFIPFNGDYRFSTTLETDLESGLYTFDVRWNSRAEAWYMDMHDPRGYLMVAGVKVVLNIPLGRRASHPFFQRNFIVAIDNSLLNQDPTFDDIGSRVQLWFLTLSDMAALRES